MKKLLGIVIAVLLFGSAQAQDRIKTFQMHKEVTEQFVGCLKREDAVAIMKDLSKGGQEVGKSLLNAGMCRIVVWPITYVELVGTDISPDGEHLTVYRGQVNKKDIFVPMLGWTHQTI